MQNVINFSNKKYFWLFVSLHIIMWTVALSLTRNSIDTSGDTVENYAWGIGWQLGYFKHPPFTAYLVALWFKLLPNTNFYYILLSQILMGACFLAVFKINSNYLPPKLAVLSVVVLEFIPFFSFLDIKVNPNSVLITSLMWVALFAYRSVMENKLIDWLLLACLAAISLLTKYTAGVMLLSLFILMLLTKEGRKSLCGFKPYVSLALFLLIITPHIYWLFASDFMPLSYASKHLEEGWTQKLKVFGILFKFILFVLVPFFVLKFIAGIGSIKLPREYDFKSLFPWFITFVPIIIIVVIAFFLGSRVSSRWIKPFLSGMPLLFLLGSSSILFVDIGVARVKKIVIAYLLVVPSLYLIASVFSDSLSKKYQAPLQQVAVNLQNEWDKEFKTKMQYVTGSYLLANSTSFYAKDHPLSWLNFDYRISPWLTPHDIKQGGLAVICYSSDEKCIVKAKNIWPDISFKDMIIQPKRNLFNIQGDGEYKYAFIGLD